MLDASRLNVAATVLVLWLSALVVIKWGPQTVKLIMTGKPPTGEDWLIAGVTIGFLGVTLNSGFWFLHYGAIEIGDMALSQTLYNAGPEANILTRVFPYSISAACHLIAFWNFRTIQGRHPILHVLISLSVAIGVYAGLTIWFP